MPLKDTQSLFKDTMLDQPTAIENPAESLHQLFTEGHVPLSDRLKIYRNNIIGGMTDNVKSAFPILEALIGTEFLELLVRSYILEHPPKQGCLNTYGAELPAFIENVEAAKAMPYLSDVARMEAAQNCAYYAPDDAPLTADDLAAMQTETLESTQLHLRASAQMIQSRFPLLAIKDFCEKQDRAKDEQLNLNQGGVSLLIYRPNLNIDIIPLANDEALFLKKLKDNQTLGLALATTLEHHPDFDIQQTLQKHLALETFRA